MLIAFYIDIWYATAYFYRDGFHGEVVPADFQAYYAGAAVEGLGLVEDEIADAVVDLTATEVLDGLQGMGMVTHQDVGTRHDELMGLHTLTGNGLEGVFCTPMK